ncbi:MAG: lyase family protein [Actinomycetota bacterium]|nr:lyase family protein [Actinomycetota bacterium]
MPAEPASLIAAYAVGDALADAVGERAWLAAMVEVEAALCRAAARVGLASAAVATAVTDACAVAAADPSVLDPDAIRAASLDGGNPVIPFVAALRAHVRATAGAEAADHVHRGPTSQDVLDSAMVLVVRRAGAVVAAELARAAGAAVALAERERATVMLARTLLQPALPTTFGAVCAGWAVALVGVRDELRRTVTTLPAQLGGAAGTLAAFGDAGPAMIDAFASELGLAAPVVPWHADRHRVVLAASALAAAAGTCEKVAADIGLLAQGEVAEVRAGTGGSSAMPHKRNPVGVIPVRAAARRAAALAGAFPAAMAHEHQRALGLWQLEWQTMADLLAATGAAAAHLADLVAGLDVDRDRMAANLADQRGLVLAEAVTEHLARTGTPRSEARRLVEDAAGAVAERGTTLADELRRLGADTATVDVARDPAAYVGAADTFVDRAVTAHREMTPWDLA